MTNDWFGHCHTLDEARTEYRRLCFVHHPDYGGDTLVMQAINAAYEQFQHALAGPRSATGPRWRKPAARRPDDIPWHATRGPEPERQPIHSRDYFKSRWAHVPWQALPHGGFSRTIWEHTVTVYRHPDPKFNGAWFVLLDDAFSPYFYDSRAEAEQAGFDLLYEKVKLLDL